MGHCWLNTNSLGKEAVRPPKPNRFPSALLLNRGSGLLPSCEDKKASYVFCCEQALGQEYDISRRTVACPFTTPAVKASSAVICEDLALPVASTCPLPWSVMMLTCLILGFVFCGCKIMCQIWFVKKRKKCLETSLHSLYLILRILLLLETPIYMR